MAEVYSKEFVTNFIELYKGLPCLWKIKDKNYRNKQARDSAYQVLVDYSRNFYSYANKDFVIRKIQSLRSSFRKEICNMKYSEDHYEPSLWYFNLLTFTRDQVVNNDENRSNPDMKMERLSDSDGSDSNNSPSPENGHRSNGDQQQAYTIEISENSETTSSQSGPSVKKKKRKLPTKSKPSLVQMPVPQKRVNFELTVSEYDSVGINVAAKLKRMEPHQATHAELLINKVLAMGLLRRLNVSHDILENKVDYVDRMNLHSEVNLSE